MSKIRLFIRKRKQGSYIASVPLKKLVKLSGFKDRRWSFEVVDGEVKGGWLILEAR